MFHLLSLSPGKVGAARTVRTRSRGKAPEKLLEMDPKKDPEKVPERDLGEAQEKALPSAVECLKLHQS